MQEWTPLATTRYQDHVIAHLVGATALGYFIIDDAAYVLLDIALIWTVYTSGEMALMPQAVVISELEMDESRKSELLADVERLHAGQTESLVRMSALPYKFLIDEVTVYEQGELRLVVMRADALRFAFEGSPLAGEIKALTGDES